MSIRKSSGIIRVVAFVALCTAYGTFAERAHAQQNLISTVQSDAVQVANETAKSIEEDTVQVLEQPLLQIDAARKASRGKIFPTINTEGEVKIDVFLPENVTAINLYRKADDEGDYQLVYQAWAANEEAKASEDVKIEILDYFVEAGKQYTYKCNFRTLINPEITIYNKDNIGAIESNEMTIIPIKGYGDFKLTNTPAATYDQKTSRITFTTLPETDMDKLEVPSGLTKQPVKFVYVNPDLYSLWVTAPDAGDVPVFITLGKIQNIDDEAQMTDVPLKSDDGDGGWRLSVDKDTKSESEGWRYEEHWYRKYTGSNYGLPATIVIPESTLQKAETKTPVYDAK